jgi:type II secretion system protein C
MKRLLIIITLLQSLFSPEALLANPFDYTVLGVIASTKDSKGVALLKKKNGGQVVAFKVGQDIGPQFSIEKVQQKTVTFLFQSKRYNLSVGDESPREVSSSGTETVAQNLQSAQGIEKAGDTLKVSRALKDNLAGENLNKVLMQAAALPHIENGRLIGFQLLEIDAGSIFDVAGFKNGDIITAINDQPINDAALAIKALNALKTASSATFGYIRGSTPMQLIVQIH